MNDEKRISLDFFKLEPVTKNEEEIPDLAQGIRKALTDIPDGFKFNSLKRTDDRIFMFGELVTKRPYILGTLVRVQLQDLPPSFDEHTQNLEPLKLSMAQGLAYPTCFLYDPDVNVVMIEHPRGGVTIGTFCKFLMVNLDIPKLDASVVINPVEMEKFLRMGVINRFHVRIAKVEDGDLLAGEGPKAVSQIIDSADQTNTDILEYKLSVRSAKGKGNTLSLARVRKWVNTFVKYKDTNEVQVLKVTGKDEENEQTSAIDLIKQRLREWISVEKQRLNGSFMINEKHEMMVEVYNKHRDGLLNMYKRKKIS